MTNLLVPRSRIPKIVAACTVCGGETRSVMSQPFADGYHRRHICRNPVCDYKFYSLTPYDGRDAQASPLPFHDRPLSEAEVSQRMQWWEEEINKSSVAIPVAGGDAPLPLEVTPTIERMVRALAKPKEVRTHIDDFLVDMVDTIEHELWRMDAEDEGKKHDGND